MKAIICLSALGFRSYILETASWVGKYLNSFVIDAEEVVSWYSVRQSTRKGYQSRLIKHYVMSFNKLSFYTKEMKSIFSMSTHSDTHSGWNCTFYISFTQNCDLLFLPTPFQSSIYFLEHILFVFRKYSRLKGRHFQRRS